MKRQTLLIAEAVMLFVGLGMLHLLVLAVVDRGVSAAIIDGLWLAAGVAVAHYANWLRATQLRRLWALAHRLNLDAEDLAQRAPQYSQAAWAQSETLAFYPAAGLVATMADALTIEVAQRMAR